MKKFILLVGLILFIYLSWEFGWLILSIIGSMFLILIGIGLVTITVAIAYLIYYNKK